MLDFAEPGTVGIGDVQSGHRLRGLEELEWPRESNGDPCRF